MSPQRFRELLSRDDLSAVIVWLLQIALYNVNAILDQFIIFRQEMISNKTLSGALEILETADDKLRENPRCIFLVAVGDYDAYVNDKATLPDAWTLLGQRFLAIEPVTLMIKCYKEIYALLNFRNAGGTSATLKEYFDRANVAAAELDLTERYEAYGYNYFNWSRVLHKERLLEEAAIAWRSATKFRFWYYKQVEKSGRGEDALLAAAQQVAKMYANFRDFFPDPAFTDPGIAVEEYQALVGRFGEEKLLAFKVKK